VSLTPGNPSTKSFVQEIVNALPGEFAIEYTRAASDIEPGVDGINFRIIIKDKDGVVLYNVPEYISANGPLHVVLAPVTFATAPARIELTAFLNFSSGPVNFALDDISLTGPSIGNLISRRNEDILFVSGIFSPETAINLRISPGQNMLRHAKYLLIPLNRKNNKHYFFQTKDKNSGLKIVTALGTSNDGEDLELGNKSYFLPEFRDFKSPITIGQLFAILANPLGLIRYSYEGEKFFDYLFEVDSEVEKALGSWTMLGTRPTPIEVADDVDSGDYLKYNTGPDDFIKYDNGDKDYVLWQ